MPGRGSWQRQTPGKAALRTARPRRAGRGRLMPSPGKRGVGEGQPRSPERARSGFPEVPAHLPSLPSPEPLHFGSLCHLASRVPGQQETLLACPGWGLPPDSRTPSARSVNCPAPCALGVPQSLTWRGRAPSLLAQSSPSCCTSCTSAPSPGPCWRPCTCTGRSPRCATSTPAPCASTTCWAGACPPSSQVPPPPSRARGSTSLGPGSTFMPRSSHSHPHAPGQVVLSAPEASHQGLGPPS